MIDEEKLIQDGPEDISKKTLQELIGYNSTHAFTYCHNVYENAQYQESLMKRMKKSDEEIYDKLNHASNLLNVLKVAAVLHNLPGKMIDTVREYAQRLDKMSLKYIDLPEPEVHENTSFHDGLVRSLFGALKSRYSGYAGSLPTNPNPCNVSSGQTKKKTSGSGKNSGVPQGYVQTPSGIMIPAGSTSKKSSKYNAMNAPCACGSGIPFKKCCGADLID